MEYNKTKRGLEKGASIYAVIVYSLMIIMSITLIVCGIVIANTMQQVQEYNPMKYYNSGHYIGGYDYYYRKIPELGLPYIIIGVILLGVTIAALIVAAKLIKSPVKPDGTIQKRTGKRITLIVFSVLSGNIILLGLMIAVMCLKDMKEPKPVYQQMVQPVRNMQYVQSRPIQQNVGVSLDDKVNQIKHLKEIGVLDDDAYKKAITKIIKEAF